MILHPWDPLLAVLATYAVSFIIKESPVAAVLEWRSEEENPVWYWKMLPVRLCDVLLCDKCRGLWTSLVLLAVLTTSPFGRWVISWLAAAGIYYLFSYTPRLRENIDTTTTQPVPFSAAWLFNEHAKGPVDGADEYPGPGDV